MKSKHFIPAALFIALLGLGSSEQVQAESNSANNKATVEFSNTDTEIDDIRDPENPDVSVDPGESPSTSGPLRIDFVPQLNFHVNAISNKDVSYPVNAQLFLDGKTEARGNFVQISDYRKSAKGWTLQLRQESQFSNFDTKNSVLNGAVLSFDKSWTNSVNKDTIASPLVSKEIIRLEHVGETYNLATAETGGGLGTWSISFGASAANPAELSSTLTPKNGKDGNPILDAVFNNQQVHENSAIRLSIPGKTEKDPVNYTTVLTWILAELP
ncbi:WxL domain-containing protein [Enterococcus sp. BWR-S5]|uniref:WxL domain-containing protein n=1 Tax=Enterococcus sp. BWR-S5 TaxID=2787714 RepID=UPI001924BA9C|nr:WxL domain-containing protein [Enterococcus sp. BWR-S5]MBL1224894.1 WxL domain-containing protein [Enterococcus sp. BWR-S5]